MNDDLTLGSGQIRQLLVEVDAELQGAEAGQSVIVVVGGSLLAWHGLRDATRDVDSIIRLGEHTRQAVRNVALRHGLAADWLNDHAAAFAPSWFDPENRARSCWTLHASESSALRGETSSS